MLDLVALGRMSVFVNRNGRILWAQLLQPESPPRPFSRAKFKPRRFELELPGVTACAVLFAVPLAMTAKELAAYQRAIFQQVLLSVKHFDLPRPAKVVSIHSYGRNHRRQPERLAA